MICMYITFLIPFLSNWAGRHSEYLEYFAFQKFNQDFSFVFECKSSSHLFSSFFSPSSRIRFFRYAFVGKWETNSGNECKKINTLLFLQYCVSLISVVCPFVRSFRFIFTLFIHKSEHESILYVPIILLTPSYRHHKSKIFFNKSKWNTRQEAG